MKKKKLVFVIGAALLILFSLTLIGAKYYMTYYDFTFYLGDTSHRLDGEVYLNGVLLGTTENGELTIEREKVSPGKVDLKGEYNKREFFYVFELTEEDVVSGELEGLVSLDNINSFAFIFYVNETDEPVDGIVYLNNKYLGSTVDGFLALPVKELFPGSVIIKGKYFNDYFEYTFPLSEEDLTFPVIYLMLEEDKLKELSFKAYDLDGNEVAASIINLANIARMESGLRPLSSDNRLVSVASSYASALYDGTGITFEDLMRDENIFYNVANLNLFISAPINSSVSESDIASDAVLSWLSDPTASSVIVDRDDLYSDMGVGLVCDPDACLVVLISAGLERSVTEKLDAGDCYIYSLYDSTLPFEGKVSARVQLNASQPVGVYFLESTEDTQGCEYWQELSSMNAKSLRKYRYDDVLMLKKGEAMLLEVPTRCAVSLLVDYQPEGYDPGDITKLR